MGGATVLGAIVAIAGAVSGVAILGGRLFAWIADRRARATGRIEEENARMTAERASLRRAGEIDGQVGRMGPAELDQELQPWLRD